MFGAILGAGTALLGGVLSHKANKSQHNDQMALANAQVQFQQDYAKNRLQWQAEDAKKAGFHPMVAAGLSPTSFSPVSYPTSSPTDYSWVSNIGQNLDYAATKAKTGQQISEAAQLMQQSQEAVVDGQELDNELKRMEIEAMRARLANVGPVAPTSNQALGLIEGQDGSISVTPSEVKSAESRGIQAGAPPSVQWFSNPDGSVTRSMSEQAKTANEDDIINTLGWHIDNNVIPFSHRFGGAVHVNPANYAPPLKYLPKGAVGWLPDGYNRFVPVYDWHVPGAFYGDDS